MNKVLVLSILILTCIIPSYGQIALNLSSGMNFSNSKFEDIDSFDPKQKRGVFIGLGTNMEVFKNIRIGLDFQYSEKGYDAHFANGGINEFRNTYLDVLAEMDYQVLKYVHVGLGVKYGLLINHKFRWDEGDWIKPEFKHIKENDIGILGKLQFQYENFFALIRYDLGIFNVANEIQFASPHGVFDVKQFNRNLQLGLGYSYRFNLLKES